MSNILLEDLEYIYKKNNANNFFQNKTVLITGAAGFLGSYMSNYLLYKFKDLKLKNIYLSDINISSIKKNIFFNKANNKCKILKSDVTDKNSSIFNIKKVDIIIHAATIASPTFYRKHPLKTAEANVDGLKNLLNFSLKKQINRILFFSSSEIYGDPDRKNIPTKETYNGNVSCMGPRACYDESKRFGETLCYIYNQTYNLPIRIVRPFNNYGPFLSTRDKRLPSDLLKKVMNNENIIIHSDGKPKRTFCYVADAICGYLNALKYQKFDVFNIGNEDEEISVSKFAKIFQTVAKKNLNYKGKIIYKKSKDKKYLSDNPQRRKPCLKKSKKELKYNPKIGIEEGITKYLLFNNNK